MPALSILGLFHKSNTNPPYWFFVHSSDLIPKRIMWGKGFFWLMVSKGSDHDCSAHVDRASWCQKHVVEESSSPHANGKQREVDDSGEPQKNRLLMEM